MVGNWERMRKMRRKKDKEEGERRKTRIVTLWQFLRLSNARYAIVVALFVLRTAPPLTTSYIYNNSLCHPILFLTPSLFHSLITLFVFTIIKKRFAFNKISVNGLLCLQNGNTSDESKLA